MKAIIFTRSFEAPDELINFCTSIGYNNTDFINDFNLMFDSRVIEFCEQKLSTLYDEMVYKGKDSHYYRIGFAGAGYIRDIDITRKWRLRYSCVDAPIIDYIDVCVNEYGFTYIMSE